MPLDFGYDVHNQSQVYASKTFVDTKKASGRRVFFGWLRSKGCVTLPREVTYNSAFQHLEYTPIPELALLRQAKVSGLQAQPV
jgi:sucrose-6-phosphate hydrolase SacC (GH32 family)